LDENHEQIMSWGRPVAAVVAVEHLTHARYGTDPVPTFAVRSLALSSERRISVVTGTMHLGTPMEIADGTMRLADAVQLLAVAPLNVSSITVQLRGASEDLLLLAQTLRAHACHSYLTGLHFPAVSGRFPRWPLTVAHAAAFVDATGGLRCLTSLTAAGPAAAQLCAVTSGTLRAVAIVGCGDPELDLSRCHALRRVGALDKCSLLSELVLPPRVTSFGHRTLHRADSLVCLDLSGTQLLSIGDDCLSRCSSLVSATFPSRLQSLGDDAMAHCPRLASVDLAGTALWTVGDRLLESCLRLAAVRFPATLRAIGTQGMANCPELRRVDVSHTALSAGEQARIQRW
jgi:hypothetical protein